ncbi:MAG: carbon-nitrogen hydrolase family protein [Sphingomonadales bacterium]
MNTDHREIFRAACVQITSGPEIDANIEAAAKLIRGAHTAGATFITTPEMVSLIEPRGKALFEKVHSQDEDPALAAFRALAAELRVWLLIGSLPIRIGETKVANRSFLIDDRGAISASYDKIHMFDVDLPDGQVYLESKDYQPGTKVVVADTPWGRLGLSVCYDLRFGYLYRALAKAGATILTVPAAFTHYTGQAHWHILVRARAIETGCFVIAPAQTGAHAGGRETYGHSLVVDPWGAVLADAEEGPGFVIADIDTALVGEARAKVPALEHDRPIETIGLT